MSEGLLVLHMSFVVFLLLFCCSLICFCFFVIFIIVLFCCNCKTLILIASGDDQLSDVTYVPECMYMVLLDSWAEVVRGVKQVTAVPLTFQPLNHSTLLDLFEWVTEAVEAKLKGITLTAFDFVIKCSGSARNFHE